MTPAAKEGLPAVVGELVAKWRADVGDSDQRTPVMAIVHECADELEATLSALTAEAGKGEVADLIAKLPSLKTLDAVDDDLGRGTRPCPLNNLTINDVKLLHRALSTATPAGEAEMVLQLLDAGGFIAPGKMEQARKIIADLTPTTAPDWVMAPREPTDAMNVAGGQSLNSDLGFPSYRESRASSAARNAYVTMLAASPRGASESGHE